MATEQEALSKERVIERDIAKEKKIAKSFFTTNVELSASGNQSNQH